MLTISTGIGFFIVWIGATLLGGRMGSTSWRKFASDFHKNLFVFRAPFLFMLLCLFITFIIGTGAFGMGASAGVVLGISVLDPLRFEEINQIKLFGFFGALLMESMFVFFMTRKVFKVLASEKTF